MHLAVCLRIFDIAIPFLTLVLLAAIIPFFLFVSQVEASANFQILIHGESPFRLLMSQPATKLLGNLFCLGPVWKAVLEGISCDQDYLRIMFDLQRGPNQQLRCPFCDSIQWISNKAPHGPLNTPEAALYTNWATDSDRKTLDVLGNIVL